ncbi:MAG TPA: GGDEF domain-containing protein [Terracidiphilus sp.]|nr:GGDEF domain-containing protein [Terracidiphilus sp.]
MYMPYLMYGYAATIILMLAGCAVIAGTVQGLRGIRLLLWALSFGLVGVILLAMRPYAPSWVTILLANEALFACSLLIYSATADTLEIAPAFIPWGIGVLAAALPANAFYTYIRPQLTARILICSSCFAIFALAKAVILFRYEEPAADQAEQAGTLRMLITSLAWVQILIMVLQILRCILTLLYPPREIVHMDLIQSGFTYLNLVLNAGGGFGLTWLALSFHRRDLHRMARTDSLTGLLNRRAFEEILARELVRANRTARSISILLIDIDRFKQVNDEWGHQAGDEVLRRVGEALRSHMRPADALSRFGGEEFVILLRDAGVDQSEHIAGRLRTDIAGLNGMPGSVQITVSIGVAASRNYDSPEELLRRCDQALYLSKRGGRNLVTVDKSLPSADPLAVQPSQGTISYS